MNAREKLSAHLQDRIAELVKERAEGTKIVGYSPGGFVPEELIYAAGAIPICLNRGGDPEPVTEALGYLPRFLDTFCRCQIGYWALGEEPLYRLPDLFVVPITDCNSKAIADSFSYYSDIETFLIGIPHHRGQDAIEYYADWLESLKERLEELTGNKITEEKLKAEIIDANRIRTLFKSISDLRRDADVPLSSREYIWWHHASYLADKTIFLECLQELFDELSAAKTDKITKRPRLMVIASTLARGDDRLFDIVEDTEAEIVIEDVSEGVRPYLDNVELNGEDLIMALANAYLGKRIVAPWDRPWDGRIDRLINTATEFKVDGVVWYQLMYRDGYDMQAFVFSKQLKEKTGLPMVKLETDYTTAEKGPMRTRFETFVEIINGG